MNVCRHCQSGINPEQGCKTCGNTLVDQCVTCHDEVAHGVIKCQNIHIIGGAGGRGENDDLDAFAKANDQD